MAVLALVAAFARPQDWGRTALVGVALAFIGWALVSGKRTSELNRLNETVYANAIAIDGSCREKCFDAIENYPIAALNRLANLLAWMHTTLSSYGSGDISDMPTESSARICSLYISASNTVSHPRSPESASELKGALLSWSAPPAWAQSAVSPAAMDTLRRAFLGPYNLTRSGSYHKVAMEQQAVDALKACTVRFPKLVARS